MAFRCPCGSTRTVWTQSHEQCAQCGRVLASCCEGAADATDCRAAEAAKELAAQMKSANEAPRASA